MCRRRREPSSAPAARKTRSTLRLARRTDPLHPRFQERAWPRARPGAARRAASPTGREAKPRTRAFCHRARARLADPRTAATHQRRGQRPGASCRTRNERHGAQSVTPSPVKASPVVPAIAHVSHCRRGRTSGAGVSSFASRASAISIPRGPISGRRARSFSRHRRNRRRIDAGVCGDSRVRSGGPFKSSARMSADLLALDGAATGQHSDTTQPNAHTSLRFSRGSPSHLGLVDVRRSAQQQPRLRHRRHRRRDTRIAGQRRCDPRSASQPEVHSILHRAPPAVTLMFAGFKSRWMTPRSCAVPAPKAIYRPAPASRPAGSARAPPIVPALTVPRARARGGWSPLGVFDAVNRRQWEGWSRAASNLGFALEAGATLGVGRERLSAGSDGDVAFESRVPSAVDLAHAPGAERREYLIHRCANREPAWERGGCSGL